MRQASNNEMLRQMFKMVNDAKSNPKEFIESLCKENPVIANDIEILLANKNDPQKLVMMALQNKGIDINMIQQLMKMANIR
jgi:hypothetical protein